MKSDSTAKQGAPVVLLAWQPGHTVKSRNTIHPVKVPLLSAQMGHKYSQGLYPASRLVLWDVIKAAKPGRSIILTTHSMEEADVLCDRLGIFVAGSLACIGHPKDIISRFCSHLLLTISVPADKEAEARQLVTDVAPGAQLTYSVGGTLKYELPTEQVSLSLVFATMAGSRATELGVLDWAVANATMEHAFIRITQQMQLTATE